MKKLSLIIICVLSIPCLKLSANPVPGPPQACINELIFDELGNWTIEALDLGSTYKIKISSLSGESEIIISSINTIKNGYYILTNENLDKPLTIRPEGDSISVNLYYEDNLISADRFVNNLCFGDQPNAIVGIPKLGESIIYLHEMAVYSLCKSPSIGFYNDKNLSDTDIFAVVKGKIYYPDSTLVMNKYIQIISEYGNIGDLYADGSGEFEGHILSAKHKNLHLGILVPYYIYYYTAENIDLDLSPNDTINIEIYLTSSGYPFPQSIESNNAENNLVRFYPNPVNEGRQINYEIDLPINTMETRVELYSLNGDLLLNQNISDNSGSLNLGHLTKGAYVLTLVSNKKTIYTTKIILN